jgi:hypothetical protein
LGVVIRPTFKFDSDEVEGVPSTEGYYRLGRLRYQVEVRPEAKILCKPGARTPALPDAGSRGFRMRLAIWSFTILILLIILIY